MGKQLASISKTLVGLLFLAGLGLYLFRQPLLDALLDRQLTSLGIPIHSLRVEEVSLNRLVLRDLSLGISDELHTDKINASWSLPGLLQGELRTIEISGLRLTVDLSGESPPLGSLQKLLEDTGEDSTNNIIPQVSLLDAQVDLRTSYGNMIVNLDGNIKQGPSDEVLINMEFDTAAAQGSTEGNLDATLDKDGNLQGALTVSKAALSLPYLTIAGLNASGSFTLVDNQLQEMTAEFALSDISLPVTGQKTPVFEQANLTMQMDASSARIKGDLFTADKVPALSFDAKSRDHQQQANIDADVNADVSAGLAVWSILGLPQPSAGSASLRSHTAGQIPAQCITNDNWWNCLQLSTVNSAGKVTLDGLGYTQKISDLNGNIAFNAKLDDGSGKLTVTEDSELDVFGLDIDWLKSLGFPTGQTSFLIQDTQLRLSASGKNSASIHLDNSTDGIKLGLETDLALSADTVEASINARAEATINKQNEIVAFKVSALKATTSGLDYAGSKLDQLVLAGSIQGSPESFAGELDLSAKAKRLRFDLLDARQANVTLPLQLNFSDQAWKLTLRKQGQISFGKLAPIETVRIPGPLAFRLPKATVELTPNTNGLAFKHQITVRPDDFTLIANRTDAPAIEAIIQPGKIVLTGEMEDDNDYSGKSTLREAGITLPQYQIQLDNVTSTIYLAAAGKGTHVDFNIGEMRHLAPTAYFSPLSLVGNAKLRRKQLSVNATGSIPGKQLLNLTARHSLAGGKGSLKLALDPLVFSPGAMQPSAIFPGLAVLEDVSGEISTSNNFNWSKEGIASNGALNVQNLSFVQNNTTLSGLSASLRMTDLLSPQSEPQQKITIQEINPGVPIKDVEISYQVQAEESPRIAIDQASLSMLGGSLSTGPAIIDPLATHNDIVIMVEDLDLTDLFELIEVEGLAGDGRLNGSIPISFDDGLVSIQDSVLTASKPGILRFQSEMVSKLLGGRAEDVDLLLQALTEFHYSELTLKLNNSANNDLVATLSLLGHNPNVKQGRLFRLNINLESNIGKILDAIAQAYGLSNKAIQRAFRLR